MKGRKNRKSKEKIPPKLLEGFVVEHYDYHTDIHINRGALDLECAKQGDMFMYYGRQMWAATDLNRRAKRTRDYVRAKLYLRYKDEGGKPTKDAIEAMIMCDEEFKEALEAYHDTEVEVTKLDLILKAMSHKRSGLERLIQLRNNSFHSDMDATEVVDHHQETRQAEAGRDEVIGASRSRRDRRSKK